MREDLLAQIQYDLEGTCKSLEEIIESLELDIDEDELEDELLNQPRPVERCKKCEWWLDVAALEIDEDLGGAVCDQCDEDMDRG